MNARFWSRLVRRLASGNTAPDQVDTGRYFYLGESKALARLTSGTFLFVDPVDETVSAHIIARGYWEFWIHDLLSALLGKGDRVVEVGANVGYYTIEMARLVGPEGSILALEANPTLTALIEASADFNGFRNVEVRQCAASDVEGRLEFIVSRRNSGGGHLGFGYGDPGADKTAIEVDSVRLDSITEGPTRLLRLDAEGSEILILRGAERLLQQPDIIICMEWDVYQMGSRGDVPALTAWLGGQGFKAWRIEPRGKTAAPVPRDLWLTPLPFAELATAPTCDILLSRRHPLGGL